VRDELLRSWRRVVLFWFAVTGIWWGLRNARIADAVRALGGSATRLTPLNSLTYAWWVMRHWTFPVLAISVGLFFLAYGVAHLLHRRRLENVQGGVPADTPWRGMKVSIGWLPHPEWEMKEPMESFQFGPYQDRFRKLPSPHRKVLTEILSVLAAYPAGEAYVGPGHTDSLLRHTLGVLQETWDQNPNPDPLLPVLAAAHDMGKIRAFVKVSTPEGDAWRRNGWHDEWSARMLSGLPSFWELSDEERRIAMLALRYGHKFSRAPLLPMAETQRMVRLHELLEGADRRVTSEEKQAVLSASAESLPELMTRAFLDALQQTMRYYGASLPKGAKANIWRNGSRVYISEPGLREALLKHLPENIAAAVSTSRSPGKFSQITEVWVEAMRVQGWLVEALPELGHEEPETGKPQPMMIANPPIWNVRSGTINLNGVFVVNLPVEELYRLGQNAPHRIFVLCPTYDSSGKALDTKGLRIPAEYLEASQAENGKALKVVDDASPETPVNSEDSVRAEALPKPDSSAEAPSESRETGDAPTTPEASERKQTHRETPREPEAREPLEPPTSETTGDAEGKPRGTPKNPGQARAAPTTENKVVNMAIYGGASPGGNAKGKHRQPRGESRHANPDESPASGKEDS
jgi:hypothetical protein